MIYRKKMSANDLGVTKSNQVGWLVGKGAIRDGIFPELDINLYNPEEQVQICVEGYGTRTFRLIWFNNRHHPERKQSLDSHGQDEYRLTRGHAGQTPRGLAAELRLRPGDQLVFCRIEGAIAMEVDRSIPDGIVSGLDAPAVRVREVQAEIDSLLRTDAGAYPDSPDGMMGDDGREERDPREGSVYVAVNPLMPGICKIGYTTRDPEVRVRELFSSNTSVPAPFEVAGSVKVPFPKRFERIIHDLWGRDRVHPDREFFNWAPDDAIERIRSAVANWSKTWG